MVASTWLGDHQERPSTPTNSLHKLHMVRYQVLLTHHYHGKSWNVCRNNLGRFTDYDYYEEERRQKILSGTYWRDNSAIDVRRGILTVGLTDQCTSNNLVVWLGPFNSFVLHKWDELSYQKTTTFLQNAL